MARSYYPPKCSYTVVGNHFETDGTVKNKISGTAMAGILGCSPWSTPFQVACALLGLGREDISGKPAVTIGTILEKPIIRYADNTWGKAIGMFVSAEEIFEKRAGDHDTWASDFEDETFSGHVDGIVMCNDGKERILEIKTSSNLESWENGVPEYYFWQVALYNHFICKQKEAYVVLGMVNEYTYKDPYAFMPCQANIKLFRMDIDDADVTEKMATIKEWYDTYILKGITPDYDPENQGDVELYEHLCNLTRDLEDLQTDLDRLAVVEQAIEEYEYAKFDLYTERELLKGNVKKYLIANKLSTLNTTDGKYYAAVIDSNRTKLDEVAMVNDGVDLKKYTRTNVVKTFSIKKSKGV